MLKPRQRDYSYDPGTPLAGWLGSAALGIPLAIMPWIYGGVQARVQLWLVGGVLGGLLCWLLIVRKQRDIWLFPTALLPLLLGLGLGGFQLLPLPAGLVQTLAPRNAELWKNPTANRTSLSEPVGVSESTAARTDGRAEGDSAAGNLTVSLYPASTRRDLASLMCAVSIFCLGAALFSQPTTRVVLWGLAAANGTAVAFWGLVLQLRPGEIGTWIHQAAPHGIPFANFINKNHAAGYLNLALAAALGFAVWSFGKAFTDTSLTNYMPVSREPRKTGSPQRPRAWRGRTFWSGFSGWQLLSLLMVAVICAGLVCTLSRGAWLAALSAAAVTSLAAGAGLRFNRRSGALLLAAGCGLALVSWLGKAGLASARWNTLWNQGTTPDGRLHHWWDAMSSVADFWSLGSGLGTYRFVYLIKSTTPAQVWFYHAENQYVEAAVEAGWLGVACLVLAIFLVAAACRRLLAEGPGSLSYATGIAGLFALVSQAIQSGFDFGLYVPANSGLFALLVGSVCGAAAQLPSRGGEWPRLVRTPLEWLEAKWNEWLPEARNAWLALPVSQVSLGMGVVLLTVAMVLAGRETAQAARVEEGGHGVNIAKLSRELPSPEQMAKLASLEQALLVRRDDAENHLKAAELWTLSCRMKLLRKWQQNWGSQADTSALWNKSAPAELHGWAHFLSQQGRGWELTALQQAEEIQEDMHRAANHLLQAAAGCPILPTTYLRLAELAPLVPGLGDEEKYLERHRELAARDDRLLAESGLVETQSGHIDRALADWKRATTAAPRDHLAGILSYASQSPALAAEIEKLLPDDAACLVELASSLRTPTESAEGSPEKEALRRRVLSRARNLLVTEQPNAEQRYLRGLISGMEEQYAEAVDQLTKAVELRPDQIGWRFELALALQKSGQIDAALEQARWCWDQMPGNDRYEQLVRNLVRSQLTTR